MTLSLSEIVALEPKNGIFTIPLETKKPGKESIVELTEQETIHSKVSRVKNDIIFEKK